ncbi:membrane protein insertion efficiency factor YidD [Candidatus Gottesmanbacteria bacterium]|nr:membrane protein insertion efficiency factor YidD [Candidatus Gottesmanbacteria bacterium]MBI5452333.1 membrane protein insertion efficiency factor YidD [Candidatus Gottesmanbacteria bacterium]
MGKFVLNLIRAYQAVFSSGVCRFQPSCSEYTYQAVEKYGTIKGLSLGLLRIVKCHPFSKGGYDPIK